MSAPDEQAQQAPQPQQDARQAELARLRRRLDRISEQLDIMQPYVELVATIREEALAAIRRAADAGNAKAARWLARNRKRLADDRSKAAGG